MEEKILIRSKNNFLKVATIWLLSTVLICLILHLVLFEPAYDETYKLAYSQHNKYHDTGWGQTCEYTSAHACAHATALNTHGYILLYVWAIPLAATLPIVIHLLLSAKFFSIVVSDKCVYLTSYLGFKIILPIDVVSDVGMWWPQGISVATASRRICAIFITNAQEIYETIRNLLVNRQHNRA